MPAYTSHFNQHMSRKTIQRAVVNRWSVQSSSVVPSWAADGVPPDQCLVCLGLECGHVSGPYLVRNGETSHLMTSITVACPACQKDAPKLNRKSSSCPDY